MSYEAYYTAQVLGNCEWYFGQAVRLITFKKERTTHFLVVPAQSTFGSTARCGGRDILISSSHPIRPIFTLLTKIQNMIAEAFTLNEGGDYIIDESKIPPDLRLPEPISPMTPIAHGGNGFDRCAPSMDTNPPTTQQGVPEIEPSLLNRADAPHPTPAVPQMPESTCSLTEAYPSSGGQPIADNPVSVQAIWPLIQQIAGVVSRHALDLGLPDDGGMGELSTMTLADIRAAEINYATSNISPQAPQHSGRRHEETPPRSISPASADGGT